MNAPLDISETVLTTERLVLRPWRWSDLEDFYEYARVDGVGQMAGWKPHESIEESREILQKFIDGRKTFAIEYQGKAIGSLGIEEDRRSEQYPQFADLKCRELGFVLSKDYWGRGFMPEAVREVIRYLFQDVGVDVIYCGHFDWNRQSQRVQEKCGFNHLGYGTYVTKLGKTEIDEVRVLTKEDWLAAGTAGANGKDEVAR